MLKYRFVLLLMVAGVLLASCEKVILPEEEGNEIPVGNLQVSVYQLEQTPFSAPMRSATSELCSRVNFAIYDMSGNRLKLINQVQGDNDFGTTSFQLTEGTYQLVVLAHSSSGNPTMTNPAKIQFTNAKGYTDTFLYHTIVTIGNAPQTLNISLHRIVALCRFKINDAIPDGIASMKFTYKGGSGHFNAATGLGVTNSTQEVEYVVQPGQSQAQYDLYTFLHDTEGTIHLKVTAFDASDNIQVEREFDIPLVQNKITWWSGDFFTGFTLSESYTTTASITINDSWDGEFHLNY